MSKKKFAIFLVFLNCFLGQSLLFCAAPGSSAQNSSEIASEETEVVSKSPEMEGTVQTPSKMEGVAQPSSGIDATVPMPPDMETDMETSPEMEEAVRVAQEQVRDPFEINFDMQAPVTPNLVESNAPQIQATLQGIGSGEGDAYAIITGDVYYLGEEKKGIKLLEVHRGKVDVLINGVPEQLRLYPEEDLKRALKGRVKRSPPETLSDKQLEDES